MQDDWERPRWADWVTRLGAAILATPDAVLVAHSSSCALVARWAASAAGAGRVRGALLGAPSDPEPVLVSNRSHRIHADAAVARSGASIAALLSTTPKSSLVWTGAAAH
jgi:predicted alpha/beta hydrolase family esterase